MKPVRRTLLAERASSRMTTPAYGFFMPLPATMAGSEPTLDGLLNQAPAVAQLTLLPGTGVDLHSDLPPSTTLGLLVSEDAVVAGSDRLKQNGYHIEVAKLRGAVTTADPEHPAFTGHVQVVLSKADAVQGLIMVAGDDASQHAAEALRWLDAVRYQTGRPDLELWVYSPRNQRVVRWDPVPFVLGAWTEHVAASSRDSGDAAPESAHHPVAVDVDDSLVWLRAMVMQHHPALRRMVPYPALKQLSRGITQGQVHAKSMQSLIQGLINQAGMGKGLTFEGGGGRLLAIKGDEPTRTLLQRMLDQHAVPYAASADELCLPYHPVVGERLLTAVTHKVLQGATFEPTAAFTSLRWSALNVAEGTVSLVASQGAWTEMQALAKVLSVKAQTKGQHAVVEALPLSKVNPAAVTVVWQCFYEQRESTTSDDLVKTYQAVRDFGRNREQQALWLRKLDSVLEEGPALECSQRGLHPYVTIPRSRLADREIMKLKVRKTATETEDSLSLPLREAVLALVEDRLLFRLEDKDIMPWLVGFEDRFGVRLFEVAGVTFPPPDEDIGLASWRLNLRCAPRLATYLVTLLRRRGEFFLIKKGAAWTEGEAGVRHTAFKDFVRACKNVVRSRPEPWVDRVIKCLEQGDDTGSAVSKVSAARSEVSVESNVTARSSGLRAQASYQKNVDLLTHGTLVQDAAAMPFDGRTFEGAHSDDSSHGGGGCGGGDGSGTSSEETAALPMPSLSPTSSITGRSRTRQRRQKRLAARSEVRTPAASSTLGLPPRSGSKRSAQTPGMPPPSPASRTPQGKKTSGVTPPPRSPYVVRTTEADRLRRRKKRADAATKPGSRG